MISLKSPTQGKGQVLEVLVDHIMNSEMKSLKVFLNCNKIYMT